MEGSEDDDDSDEDSEEEEEEDDEDDEVSQRLALNDGLPSSMEGMVVSREEPSNTQTSQSGDSRANEGQLSGSPPGTIDEDESDVRKEKCGEPSEMPSSLRMEESGMDVASSRCIHDDQMEEDEVDESRTTHAASSSGAGDGLDASCAPSLEDGEFHNTSHLLNGEELLAFLREVHHGRSKVIDDILTVGMVG